MTSSLKPLQLIFVADQKGSKAIVILLLLSRWTEIHIRRCLLKPKQILSMVLII